MNALYLKMTVALLALLPATYASSQLKLEKLWETDSVLSTPESVLFDETSGVLFVSNIGIQGEDSTGSISKVDLDGNIIENNWVTGLTGTKGMGLHNNLLYAAENKAVAVIDIDKGALVRRVSIDSAQFLNDITIDANGVVYVSDTEAGKVYTIENDTASLYMENLPYLNGLLSVGDTLYLLTDGKFVKADAQKNIHTITEGIEGFADGIVKVNDSEFIVTGWAGMIYHVAADGTNTVLSDTREQQVSAADPGYNPLTNTLYIPTFATNTVVAYKVLPTSGD